MGRAYAEREAHQHAMLSLQKRGISMYILRESNQNVEVTAVEGTAKYQKISGTYNLIGDRGVVSLKYFDLNTENPQGRITINGLEMESQPYPDAEAEFRQIVDATAVECKATKQSFLNLSDIQLTVKRAPQKPKTETPTETEVPEPEPQELTPTEAETAKDPLSS